MKLGPEDSLQILVMDYIFYKHNAIWDDTYHFAGERRCSPLYGHILKRKGVKAGVADIFICVPRGTFHGLWMELKCGKNKPTESQKSFLSRMTLRGYLCGCLVGFEASIAFLEAYLAL